MYDLETSLDTQILAHMKNRPTVVFIEPLDPRIIEAACHLTRFVRPVFLASEAAVREVIARDLGHLDPTRVRFTLAESAFIDIEARADLREQFARACLELPPEVARAHTLDEARALVRNPAKFGIMCVRLGHADMVVGGADHEPRDYFRPMLRLLHMQRIQCEAGVFVLPDDFPGDVFPHNIVVFGDVGVNGTMTPEILAHCAVGTCAVARDLIPEDVLPVIKGAIVSYSHRGADEGPAADLVRDAMALVPGILAERVAVGARYASIRIHGRGEGERGALAPLRHLLPRRGCRAGRRHERPHLPEPRHGEPALPPVRVALPRGEEVPGDVRPALPRRGPAAGLHHRGRPPGGQGQRAAPAPLRALEPHAARHVLPPLPHPGGQPRLDLHQDRRLRGGPGGLHDRARSTPAAELAPFEGQAHHGAVRLPQGGHPATPSPRTSSAWPISTRCRDAAACCGRSRTAPTP